MSKKDIHIVPRGEQWAVIKEGNERASSLHDTQREAIERGREQAKREEAELVTHNRQGQIRDSDSYGKDPSPPIDQKH